MSDAASRTHRVPAQFRKNLAQRAVRRCGFAVIISLIIITTTAVILRICAFYRRESVNLTGGIRAPTRVKLIKPQELRRPGERTEGRTAAGNYFNRRHTTLLKGLIKGHRNVSRVSPRSQRAPFSGIVALLSPDRFFSFFLSPRRERERERVERGSSLSGIKLLHVRRVTGILTRTAIIFHVVARAVSCSRNLLMRSLSSSRAMCPTVAGETETLVASPCGLSSHLGRS